MNSKIVEIVGTKNRGRQDLGHLAHRPLRNRLLSIILAVLSLLVIPSAWGETLDYSVVPKPSDNFLAASFRFTSFQGGAPSNIVLVFVPGTDGDGRDVVTDREFLKISAACHANLLGCYYRGEGLSYDDPAGGSGRALDEALAHFAAKTGQSQLSQAELLPIGFSQGGMFVFNYVCWRPARVKAFASLRAIFPRFKPQAASFKVPGLLAAGEYDQPGRIRSIASVFSEAEDHDSRWALLWEKRSGHDVGSSVELAGSLFEAICQDNATKSPLFLDTMAKETNDPSCQLSNLCWFPNQRVADLWKSLHRAVSLENLVSLPDRPRLQNLISIRRTPDSYQCKNGDRQFGSIFLSARDARVAIGRVQVTGDGFTLVGSAAGKLPLELKVCFAPKEMPWGETRAKVVVTGEMEGQMSEAVDATLFGMVKGLLKPVPSTAYLGITVPGQAVQKTILLKSSQSQIHLADIRAPDGVTVTLNAAKGNGDWLLHIHWVGGHRLGRMQGQVELAVDAPERGTLRIPIFGFVTQANSRSNLRNLVAPVTKVCSNSQSSRSPFPIHNGYGTQLFVE